MKRKRWTEGMRYKLISQAVEKEGFSIIQYSRDGGTYTVLAFTQQGTIAHIKATIHGDICKWEPTGVYKYVDFDMTTTHYHEYEEMHA